MSRAPRPTGTSPWPRPAWSAASQASPTWSTSTNSSKPSSPVYPVRATSAGIPATVALRDAVVADGVEVEVGEGSEDVERARTLDRHEPGRERPVVEDGAEPRQPLRERVGDDPRVRRVRDDHEPVVGEAVDDEVVEDPPVGRADHRVVRAPDGEGGRVGDERRRERGPGLRPLDDELAHVRQVEQAGRRADGAVLLEDPAVLDRHQPAGELDDPRAQRLVAVEQRGGQRRGHLGHRVGPLRRASGTCRRRRPRRPGPRGPAPSRR